MRIAHGDVVHLNIEIARKMQARGEVKIIQSISGEPFEPRLRELDDSAYLTRKSFSNDGKVRVAWVQDYHKNGGAELSNFIVVRAGNNCGFDIVGITPVNFDIEILKQSDIAVINNFFEFTEEQKNILVEYLYTSKKPYIKYEHDHREIARPAFSSRLFGCSSLSVFISPSQMERHKRIINTDKSLALPLAIDTEKFVNTSKDRNAESIFVPSFDKCKINALKFMSENANKKYTIIGHIDSVHINECSVLQPCSLEKIVQLYNEHSNVLHVPDKPGGGERVIFEAVLCGCNVICNENASHSSWDFWKNEKELRKRLNSAPYEFWKLVEKCLQKQ